MEISTFFRHAIVFLSIYAAFFFANAQNTRVAGFVDTNNGRPQSMINEIPYVPKEYEGTHFIHEEWADGYIELKDSSLIKTYPLRYDLKMERLEIETPTGIKILTCDRVNFFEWLDPKTGEQVRYVNADQYHFLKTNMGQGMFEVVVDGDKMKLISKWGLKVQEGNYNVQLDMGDRTPKLLKEQTFFLLRNDIVLKLPNSKNERYLFFKGKSKEVEAYAKSQKLKFKKREDLARIVGYYNSI